MMCTLWMGWQVIDSMEMGRRGEHVGDRRGVEERGVRGERAQFRTRQCHVNARGFHPL